jgi:hypothetical protein
MIVSIVGTSVECLAAILLSWLVIDVISTPPKSKTTARIELFGGVARDISFTLL